MDSRVTGLSALFPTFTLTFKPEVPMKPSEVLTLLEENVHRPTSILQLKAYADGSYIVTIVEHRACEKLLNRGANFQCTKIIFKPAQSNVRGFRIKNLPRNVSHGTVSKELRRFGRVLSMEREKSSGPSSGRRVYIELKAALPTPVQILDKFYETEA